MKNKKLKNEISRELEVMFDKLPRYGFEGISEHEFIDTCDVYVKVFQRYRRQLKDKGII